MCNVYALFRTFSLPLDLDKQFTLVYCAFVSTQRGGITYVFFYESTVLVFACDTGPPLPPKYTRNNSTWALLLLFLKHAPNTISGPWSGPKYYYVQKVRSIMNRLVFSNVCTPLKELITVLFVPVFFNFLLTMRIGFVLGFPGDGGRGVGLRNGRVLHDVHSSTKRSRCVYTVQQSQGTQNRSNAQQCRKCNYDSFIYENFGTSIIFFRILLPSLP